MASQSDQFSRYIERVAHEVIEGPIIAESSEESLNRLLRFGREFFDIEPFVAYLSKIGSYGEQHLERAHRLIGEWIELYFRMGFEQNRFFSIAEGFFSNPYWPAIDVTAVLGVCIRKRFDLSAGIYLLPVDKLPVQPYHIARVFTQRDLFPYSECALVRELSVPNPYYQMLNDCVEPINRAKEDSHYDNLREQKEVIRLCLALSGGSAVYFTGGYTTSDPSKYPPPQLGIMSTLTWYGIGSAPSELPETTSQLIDLVMPMCNRGAWSLGVDRLIRSRSALNEVDPIIDIGMAAEILLMHSSNGISSDGKGEIKNKLINRAAWLVGHDAEERQQIASIVGAIYDARSRAVHTGRAPKSRLPLYPVSADSIVSRIALEIATRGGFPDWGSLVLGGGAPPTLPDRRAELAEMAERQRVWRQQNP